MLRFIWVGRRIEMESFFNRFCAMFTCAWLFKLLGKQSICFHVHSNLTLIHEVWLCQLNIRCLITHFRVSNSGDWVWRVLLNNKVCRLAVCLLLNYCLLIWDHRDLRICTFSSDSIATCILRSRSKTLAFAFYLWVTSWPSCWYSWWINAIRISIVLRSWWFVCLVNLRFKCATI